MTANMLRKIAHFVRPFHSSLQVNITCDSLFMAAGGAGYGFALQTFRPLLSHVTQLQ
jgi:hypothetical protein